MAEIDITDLLNSNDPDSVELAIGIIDNNSVEVKLNFSKLDYKKWRIYPTKYFNVGTQNQWVIKVGAKNGVGIIEYTKSIVRDKNWYEI